MLKARLSTAFQNLFLTKAQRLANAAKEFNVEEVTHLTATEYEPVKWDLLTETLDIACSLNFESEADKASLDSKIIPTFSVLCKNIATRVPGFNWSILLFEIAKYLAKHCNEQNKKLCIRLVQMLQQNVFEESEISASGKVIKPEISINALPIINDVQKAYSACKKFYGLADLPATLSLISQLLILLYLELHSINNQAIKDAKPRAFSAISFNTRQIITSIRKASESEQIFLKALTTEFEPIIIIPPSDITFLQALGNKLMIWQNVAKKPDDTEAPPSISIHTLDEKNAVIVIELPLFAQPYSASSDQDRAHTGAGASYAPDVF